MEDFKLPEEDMERVPMVPMTLWIPSEYKERYQLIQSKSNRKFSKYLVKVIKSAIDKVQS